MIGSSCLSHWILEEGVGGRYSVCKEVLVLYCGAIVGREEVIEYYLYIEKRHKFKGYKCNLGNS